MKIVGLAGSLASGKDTVAHMLVDKFGFFHVSTGDIVREIAQEKYGSIERPVLYKTANDLRHERGAGALSLVAIERFKKIQDGTYNGLVISGLRALGEAQVIKDADGVIVFVDAPIEIRYERMIARARDKEMLVSLEEFEKRERDENGGVDPDFSIIAIKSIADTVILNDGSQEDFLTQARRFVDTLRI